MKRSLFCAALTSSVLLTLTSACSGPLELRIIHMNDIHSHLSAEQDFELSLAGQDTFVELGGIPRAVNFIEQQVAEVEHALILNAGDTFQGTLYYTLFKGDATAEMMNLIDWDAIVLGNHEFDDGDQHLADYLDKLNGDIVAANVIPDAGNVLEGKWSPYIIKEIGSEQVAIIGIDVKQKTEASSNPSDEITFQDELTTAQYYADLLRNDYGIDKIILLSHYGLKNDMELAQKITGIDIIIDGDSHSLMGDVKAFGLGSSYPYPVQTSDKDGNPVCIAQAWEYAKAVGSLDVSFDDNGQVTSCSGAAVLPVGSMFKRKDANGNKVEVSILEQEEIKNFIETRTNIAIVEEDTDAATSLQTYSDKVDVMKAQVIGQAGEELSHVRIPGIDYLGNSGAEFPLGSEIAPLVAKGFYELSLRADACIQNAGGVRINVQAGDVTYDTAYTLLPFSNTLFEIEMKGSEIKQALEDALTNYYDNGGSSGSFPYSYGLRYDINMSNPANMRIKNLEIMDRTSKNWTLIQENTMYVIVTNSYTGQGKDGYLTFKDVQDQRGPGIDTYLDYAMSFVTYVGNLAAEGKKLEPLPGNEHCIKSYYFSQHGDINNDGLIDRNDLTELQHFLRQSAGKCPECDLDADGTITIMDARQLTQLLGK
ncbi:5'-nucleotidase C-terminal domain-containing protein [Desulfogranum japonicum]|uniref:5'-nucleotidase C-terminal domain-containing protein n=1 Tax=Desulfogranum japonicum TaxID=231447 RepID=UPI0004077B9F|nr:5'-nucleotidase C-terminal domain-containing protein [Desulfogranum japonicum]